MYFCVGFGAHPIVSFDSHMKYQILAKFRNLRTNLHVETKIYRVFYEMAFEYLEIAKSGRNSAEDGSDVFS